MSQAALSALAQHLWFEPGGQSGVCLAKRLNNVRLRPPRAAVAAVGNIFTMDDAAAQRAEQWWAPAVFQLGEKRRIASIEGIHALWMDIDFKHYECDEPEAIEIIKRLLEALPPSAVIYTGGGLHVYWLLHQWLRPAAWKALAVGLSTMATELGVIHDSKVTRNAAALMRIPGAWSAKRGIRTRFVQDSLDRVYTIEYLESVLPKVAEQNSGSKVLPDLNFDLPDFGYYDSLEAAQAAEGGAVSEFEPVALKTLVASCPQVGEFVRLRGRVPEPVWYAMAGIFPHVENGIELYHKISSGDPRYDRDQCQKKLDQWEGAVGLPPTCEAMADCDAAVCGGCPHKGAVNSPLGAARIMQAADTVQPVGQASNTAQVNVGPAEHTPVPTAYVPVPPPGYVASGGRLYRLVQSAEGDNSRKFLCGALLLPLEVMADYDDRLRELRLQVQDAGFAAREIQIPVDAFSDQRQLHKELRQRSVFVEQHLLKDVAKYLDDCAQTMLRMSRVCRIVDRLGWTPDGVFVLGNAAYKPAGVQGEVQISGELAHNLENAQFNYGARGSLDKWKAAVRIYDHVECEAYQLTVLTAFAAPLMKASGYRGALLSLVGSTAVGKSTAMAIANSVYGEMFSEQFGRADTDFGRFKVIGMLNNLPVYLDEATIMTPEETSKMVFSLTQGRSGVAGTTDGNLRGNMATWDTIMVSGSNVSLHAMLAENSAVPDPEVRRVLEIMIPGTPLKQSNVDAARRVIADNYGGAGDVWLRHLVSKGLDHWRKIIHAAEDELTAQFPSSRENRFTVLAIGACALVAARETAALGLLPFDPDMVPALLHRVLDDTDDTLHEIKRPPVEVVADMLAQLEPFTRRVSIDENDRIVADEPPLRAVTLVRADSFIGGKQIIHVRASEFRKYLLQNRMDAVKFTDYLERVGVVQKTAQPNGDTRTMWCRLAHKGPPSRVYSLDIEKLDGFENAK